MAEPLVFNRAGELPAWARWSSAGAERPWTVGLEEEVVLLDPRDWSVANRIDDVLDALPSAIVAHASAETHACVLELNTGAHATVADAAAAPAGRFGRNRTRRRGEDGMPAGLDHLRANARFCSDTCKKQARRSPNRQKPARNRQCLRGVSSNTFGRVRV